MIERLMINLPPRYSNVKSVLHGGGMSETLLCKDAHLERSVVVKSLKAGVDPKRLLDEISALSAITSKHVVQVYDVVRDKSGAVIGIVEEYLGGTGLEEGGPVTNALEAMRILYPIAAGIADIHSHGRVHRDIKPSNMKRDAQGCLKIFDFGLAKIAAENPGTKALFFTPGFTPPEALQMQADGTYAFTEAVDSFAFGVTAYCVLTKKGPPPYLCKIPPEPVGADMDFGSFGLGLPAPIVAALNSCLNVAPETRCKMIPMRDLIGRHLLTGRHRASFVFNGKESVLDATHQRVKFTFDANTSLAIEYDGLSFRVYEVNGPVFINNLAVNVGFELPGACIIVLGVGKARGMVPVSVAYPEVAI